MADLDRWRHGASVEPERARAVLSQWKQDDGGGDHNQAELCVGQSARSFRKAVHPSQRSDLELRRIARRAAVLDGQAHRTRAVAGAGDANPRWAEMVCRIEGPRTYG